MFERQKSRQASPATLQAELATARRIANTLSDSKDREAVEDYIRELEFELSIARSGQD